MAKKIIIVEDEPDFLDMLSVILAKAGYEIEGVDNGREALSAVKLVKPDLIILDGGKGQLAHAQKAAQSLGIKIPMAALAKREEEVFVPGKSESVCLDRADAGLRLLMRMRDEAHRFGITYHKYLRNKKLIEG